MSSLQRIAPLLIALILCSAARAQQPSAPDWKALRFLEGKWVGEGSSEAGRGSGYFSFEPDLQNKVWVRKNHAEYPATKGRARLVHEDLMIVYFDQAAGHSRAFYCDSEGHIIQYTAALSSDGNTLTFLSDREEGVPRYRLTYVRGAPGHMSVTLEAAKLAQPDEFQKIVSGNVSRLPDSSPAAN